MVSIRLLDDEYEQLKQFCLTKGARSVSDLAREAMFRMLPRPAGDSRHPDLADQVRRLDQTVAALGEKMEAIESRLAGSPRMATWDK